MTTAPAPAPLADMLQRLAVLDAFNDEDASVYSRTALLAETMWRDIVPTTPAKDAVVTVAEAQEGDVLIEFDHKGRRGRHLRMGDESVLDATIVYHGGMHLVMRATGKTLAVSGLTRPGAYWLTSDGFVMRETDHTSKMAESGYRSLVRVGTYEALTAAFKAHALHPHWAALYAECKAEQDAENVRWKRDNDAATAKRAEAQAKVDAINAALGRKAAEVSYTGVISPKYPVSLLLEALAGRYLTDVITTEQRDAARALLTEVTAKA